MFWGKLRQWGQGTNVSSSIEGESQQHTDYSTLLASPHFTVATNITLVAGRQSQSHHLLDTLMDNYSTSLASQ